MHAGTPLGNGPNERDSEETPDRRAQESVLRANGCGLWDAGS